MQTNPEPGVTGAKRATWRETNPRALFLKLMQDNPTLDQVAIRKLFWREYRDDQEVIESIIFWWCDNNFRSATQDAETTKQRNERMRAQATATAEAKEKLKERIAAEVNVILLDLIMPNGKQLRDCTGADCKSFGGWLFKVAGKVPANKKVGNILSEAQLQKLWKS